jgi:hypothetical protein
VCGLDRERRRYATGFREVQKLVDVAAVCIQGVERSPPFDGKKIEVLIDQ